MPVNTTGGTYPLVHNQTGDGSIDHKFVIQEAGEYVITVDLISRTVNFAPYSITGLQNNNIGEIFSLNVSDAINVIMNENYMADVTTLYDMTGKIVDTKRNMSGTFILGNNLSKGIYLVKVETIKKTFTQKVMIK